MEMRAESQPGVEKIVDATAEKELDNAWTFVMRNIEHLVREIERDAGEDQIEQIRRDLESEKITILMECKNRDQVSLRIRLEIKKRLAAALPESKEERRAA